MLDLSPYIPENTVQITVVQRAQLGRDGSYATVFSFHCVLDNGHITTTEVERPMVDYCFDEFIERVKGWKKTPLSFGKNELKIGEQYERV